ncbi:hypothetical protein BRADI_2g37547v3 [Brachypodium distachyon]|uniref:Magnesium transporter n=1 Tax=Brachypodium distachyon TaxID=15368 RepID=A0A0Q3MTW3_BRADI|nr:hypothetical protein BRADI_2g37547v3 [Brachypodium distachyon]KQK07774.1 hypothetical protein BRADI_2g37547v3 [Brachypodium distachyon]PNT71930.1 hypothetical protein BRADI_2g37547v3 [Brachypodium distachyon]
MEGGGGRSGVVVDIDAAVDDDGGSRTRPWVRVDAETGESEEMELSKQAVMRRMGVPARDLRALDPLLGYTASILARGYAIVCNLEQIRCIISSEEALVMRVQGDQGDDDAAARYADELKRRLAAGRHAAAGMPFELIAFGVALECISSVFKSETADIEIEAYPALDELAKKVSTLNLERARRLKSRLAALTKRVQRIRDEIEQLMDDDDDMADCYLTNKMRMDGSILGLNEGLERTGNNNGLFGRSSSAPLTTTVFPKKKVQQRFLHALHLEA